MCAFGRYCIDLDACAEGHLTKWPKKFFPNLEGAKKLLQKSRSGRGLGEREKAFPVRFLNELHSFCFFRMIYMEKALKGLCTPCRKPAAAQKSTIFLPQCPLRRLLFGARGLTLWFAGYLRRGDLMEQQPSLQCPYCQARFFPNDAYCLGCGADLALFQHEQYRQRQQQKEAQEVLARREKRLAPVTPLSAKCTICQQAPAQARCALCMRLLCRHCIHSWEPDFLCASCETVTQLEYLPEEALPQVAYTLQTLEPALARHAPRKLAQKVRGLLSRGKALADKLGAAGAWEAQHALATALQPVQIQWKQPLANSRGAIAYAGPAISLAAPSSSQRQICAAVLQSLAVQPFYGTKVDHYVLEAARSAGIPAPKVWLSPSPAPNACAMGFTAADAHIVVTAGLLRACAAEELRGVIGHEVAHIACADSVRNTALAARAMGIAVTAEVLGDVVQWGFLADGNPDNDYLGLALAGAIRAIGVAAAAAAMERLSRELQRREFAADALGASFMQSHFPLASALVRLEALQNPQAWAGMRAIEASHMFFVPTGLPCAFSELHSHPPTTLRYQALRILGAAQQRQNSL